MTYVFQPTIAISIVQIYNFFVISENRGPRHSKQNVHPFGLSVFDGEKSFRNHMEQILLPLSERRTTVLYDSIQSSYGKNDVHRQL